MPSTSSSSWTSTTTRPASRSTSRTLPSQRWFASSTAASRRRQPRRGGIRQQGECMPEVVHSRAEHSTCCGECVRTHINGLRGLGRLVHRLRDGERDNAVGKRQEVTGSHLHHLAYAELGRRLHLLRHLLAVDHLLHHLRAGEGGAAVAVEVLHHPAAVAPRDREVVPAEANVLNEELVRVGHLLVRLLRVLPANVVFDAELGPKRRQLVGHSSLLQLHVELLAVHVHLREVGDPEQQHETRVVPFRRVGVVHRRGAEAIQLNVLNAVVLCRRAHGEGRARVLGCRLQWRDLHGRRQHWRLALALGLAGGARRPALQLLAERDELGDLHVTAEEAECVVVDLAEVLAVPHLLRVRRMHALEVADEPVEGRVHRHAVLLGNAPVADAKRRLSLRALQVVVLGQKGALVAAEVHQVLEDPCPLVRVVRILPLRDS
mmetsp:Transcript_14080/g.55447  ORF Transcript_14080/g.55447 Transcript_14080/m.55447 type:complete len:433 (-) Transcript_14080:168-1466(-)